MTELKQIENILKKYNQEQIIKEKKNKLIKNCIISPPLKQWIAKP